MQHRRNENKQAKTEVLHLLRNPDQCKLQVNGATLKQVEKLKYLGVTFTSDGRQDDEPDGIGVARIFDWGGGGKPQITCNVVIKSFQKRNFLRG